MTTVAHRRGSRAVLAMASASIAFSCDLVSSFGGLPAGLRADTTLKTGPAQAAKSAGFRLGTDTIFGFAVGGLCPRFKPMRSNLAHTASRLCPRRLAICPALWPLDQSFFKSATLAASHITYCLTPKVRVLPISPRERRAETRGALPEHGSKFRPEPPDFRLC